MDLEWQSIEKAPNNKPVHIYCPDRPYTKVTKPLAVCNQGIWRFMDNHKIAYPTHFMEVEI